MAVAYSNRYHSEIHIIGISNLIFICMASRIGLDAIVGMSDLTNEMACVSVGVPTG